MNAKPEIYVSIGEMKKRLSELTNRADAMQTIRNHRQSILARRRQPVDVDIVEIIHEVREERDFSGRRTNDW